ncbi:MAG: hypothetical protein CK528_09475 [Alcaligenaceae bacterium]|nr:MAG: hypothetical protein CK528_09475 [Alcaligenaceae bacterium]
MQIPLQFDLFQFLKRESPNELKRLFWLAIFVGLLNTALVGLVNIVAKKVEVNDDVTLHFFVFALILIIFLLITKRANKESITSTQDLLYKFRLRILKDVFTSTLTRVDSVGRGYILEVLIKDIQVVSQAMSAVVNLLQSLATLVFLNLYMATVSFTAFIIIFSSSLAIIFIGSKELFKVTNQMGVLALREHAVTALYADFLNGYKEVKMNSRRAYDLTLNIMTDSRVVNELKSGFLIAITNFFNYLQVLLYVVVGVMIFVVPILASGFADQVTTAATTALFLAGSLTGIITSVPSLSTANVSARALFELSNKLETSTEQTPKPKESFDDIKSLSMLNVSFSHESGQNVKHFFFGPVTYTFDINKVYFIRGNNGSGKTTLMRLLLGLYEPMTGQILVNDRPIQQPSKGEFRDLFGVVFSDFYLFKKLYGIHSSTEEEIDHLLEVFQMKEKVSVIDGSFSDVNLSTGQRKRLALIVALLENRQFIILDEWAADQDPEFRQEFYEHIIPRLREMGKTVIAITHDDHYYHLADHVLFMENGKLISTT